VVPDPEWLADWCKQNSKPRELAVIYQDPALIAACQAAVDRVNKNVSSTEKMRRVAIAREAFTVENEQMTPTLKIRRHVIKRIYGDVLEGLYN
jgi:long-chain acyl-CoA synthetase